jgi:hypothetical protein
LGKLMLRWVDGFEHYGLSELHMLEGVGGAAAWSEIDSQWDLSSANPATGDFHMRLDISGTGTTEDLRRAFGQSTDIAGVGYRFAISALPNAESVTESANQMAMINFRDVANANQVRVSLGTEGSVYACRTNTLLGRSDPCIAAGGYHHFEAKTKIDNTTGYIEVRVNEVTVLNLTGIDTQASANAETSQFRVGNIADSPGTFNFDLDDIFAWDDDASDLENTVVDFVGDKGCYYLPVNADTAEADFTKSTGVTGYTLLDELTPDDADYIADTTGVARSIFGVAALPANVAEVIAMMPVIRARKEESGSVTLRGGVVVGASESYTPDNSPSTAFAYMTPGPKTIDPDTGVAWASNADPSLLIERTV